MEDLSRGRAIDLIARLVVLIALAGAFPVRAWADPPNVVGTWHVTVEYVEDEVSGPRS